MFDWDEDNIRHIARHGVSPEEAEQALSNDPTDGVEQEHDGEQRFEQIGVTDAGRCPGLVTTWRGEYLRVVTAYAGTPSDLKYYMQRKR